MTVSDAEAVTGIFENSSDLTYIAAGMIYGYDRMVELAVDYVGAIDNNADDAAAADKKYAEDALNSILKGQAVAVAGTKAVGCGIKWKKS
jgi:hypothetical protein